MSKLLFESALAPASTSVASYMSCFSRCFERSLRRWTSLLIV